MPEHSSNSKPNNGSNSKPNNVRVLRQSIFFKRKPCAVDIGEISAQLQKKTPSAYLLHAEFAQNAESAQNENFPPPPKRDSRVSRHTMFTTQANVRSKRTSSTRARKTNNSRSIITFYPENRPKPD